jgi:PIN domain nuclease of toxin-antitoxin system
MKYLVDTHVFIWYLKGEEKLSDESRSILDEASNEVLLAMLVFGK